GARALRRGRAQPARLSLLGGPRGEPAAADSRAGAALAQPAAAQGGAGGPGEPRGGDLAFAPSAAGERPAQDRGLMGRGPEPEGADRRALGAGAAPALDLRALIRDIPDFPRPGILFKDITPLLADAQALKGAVRG